MQTRSYLQRRSHSESSDRLVVNLKPRPWSDPHQQQAAQPQPIRHDFSHVDLFAHDPGPRTIDFRMQPKLTVGAPNDVYEQEADRVAEQVMTMPDTKSSVQREAMPEEDEELQTKPLGGSIQREALPEEDEELQTKPLAATITPLVQREALPEEEEELQAKPLSGSIQREAMPEEDEELQTKRSNTPHSPLPTPSLENRLTSSQGGGRPLPDEVRTFMEPRFGADFSQVRVHTGSDAVQMNRDLHAQAFTHKQDVYFGAGKAPAKDSLTAHELTHVLQQTSQKVQPQLQRDDDDSNEPAKLKYELVYLPIDLKDKNNKLISTQSISLELSLRVQAPFNATAGGFKFSFLKPQLSLALGAAFENPTGAATDINKSLSGGASISIVEVKIPGLSKFLPGTKFKIGGKLESEVDIDALKVETKAKPSIGIKIPLSESQYIELGATSSGAQILGTF